MDLLVKKRAKRIGFLNRPSPKLQAIFLKRLGLLLKEGFALKDALDYLYRISPKEIAGWALESQQLMATGLEFYQSLDQLAFPKRMISQLYFASQSGRFTQAVYESGAWQLKHIEKKRKFINLLHYPIILITFALGMLLGIRFILLPPIENMTNQGSETSLSLTLVLSMIKGIPYLLVLSLILLLLLSVGFKLYFAHQSTLSKANFIARWPIVGSLYKLYHSQFLSLEWGHLLTNGSSPYELIHLMIENVSHPLVRELGESLKTEMLAGKNIAQAVKHHSFLKEELAEIIAHGQVTGKLGMELVFYANQCEEELGEKIEKLMTIIQPLIFLGIAAVIIIIYLSILLPTFNIMSDL